MLWSVPEDCVQTNEAVSLAIISGPFSRIHVHGINFGQ